MIRWKVREWKKSVWWKSDNSAICKDFTTLRKRVMCFTSFSWTVLKKIYFSHTSQIISSTLLNQLYFLLNNCLKIYVLFYNYIVHSFWLNSIEALLSYPIILMYLHNIWLIFFLFQHRIILIPTDIFMQLIYRRIHNNIFSFRQISNRTIYHITSYQ